LDDSEQISLKSLISARDLVPLDDINTSAVDSDDEEDGSVRSFFGESEEFFELILFQPAWAKKRSYQALLVSQSSYRSKLGKIWAAPSV